MFGKTPGHLGLGGIRLGDFQAKFPISSLLSQLGPGSVQQSAFLRETAI